MAFRDGQQMTNPKFPGQYRYYYKGNALTEDEYMNAAGSPPPLGQGTQNRGTPATGADLTGRMMQSKKYIDKRAELMAKNDEQRLGQTYNDLQEALGAQPQLDMMRETARQAPTGSFAPQRQALGKNLGKVFGGLAGIPTFEEATALENLNTLKAERTLGDVSKLKGPLSDKDVAFLSQLQVDPYASKEHNQFVAKMQTWANARKAGYNSAMQAWAERLGSPRVRNAQGVNFDQWWAQWSEAHIPRPSATVPTRRQQQNADLKARSARVDPAVGRILEVSD